MFKYPLKCKQKIFSLSLCLLKLILSLNFTCLVCGGLNTCRNVKYIWSSHFSKVIRTNMLLETKSLCLNTQLRVKKIFQFLHYFYWNLGNPLTFMCSPLMTSIIFNPQTTNTQENFIYVLDFYVLADNHIPHFEELKGMFFTYFHCSTSYVLKRFGCFDVHNRLSNWNKHKNLIFVLSILQIWKL